MMDPRRKSAAIAQTAATSLRKRAAARTTAGRWSLLCDPQSETNPGIASHKFVISTGAKRSGEICFSTVRPMPTPSANKPLLSPPLNARCLNDAARFDGPRLHPALRRYGVLFRELFNPRVQRPWQGRRELAPILRRLEACARNPRRPLRLRRVLANSVRPAPKSSTLLRQARRDATQLHNPDTPSPLSPPPTSSHLRRASSSPASVYPACNFPGREAIQFQNGARSRRDRVPTVVPLLGHGDPTTTPKSPNAPASIADILRGEAVPTRSPRKPPNTGTPWNYSRERLSIVKSLARPQRLHEPQHQLAPETAAQEPRPEEGEFYFEGPYMVFTEAYHLRRGYCCNSDCRHCPYR